MDALTDLLSYTARILPGLALIAACLLLARGRTDPLLPIGLLVLGFVLIRDTMTPTGLWRLGTAGYGVWLRLSDDAVVLTVFGVLTLALTAAVLVWAPRLRALVVWGRPSAVTLAVGAGGGVLAAAPVLALTAPVPLAERGGAVALGLLPFLLWFSMAGNLAEEVLFRGLLQGRLERDVSPLRAALLSAAVFAACHVFLATTVTDIGWPLLAFTLYEGLICALLRMRHGVVPAALAHGTAVFLLAAGLR
ncbi:CPBP family intramembrane glutamic endopeptidase [Marinitenerispora sediminis]|uniref:CPBP family intramembrane metalloprotease n=1 Tax=Marinitenerispora sediminis TaxID=1931232 RepID=A0A368TA05_9ACTN|nr:CPBP family intramembrane glutamic endopeptidase [Marinitenerispora sediminis]RCV52906.1 CPBP family intramembrane metalloprotease [Marinitenerispora sediminis]RCV60723.1 CPBP family intramembrane metalloprotease [Marinitenerispora sediminis]RCV61585.1 CPBP family intramembrane metalloprotease [Marinitenerispora sediminis]